MSRGGKVIHGHARHGLKSPEYRIWCAMHERCSRPKHTEYPRYGGRGIKVCERWGDFATFLADMGPRPSPRHSIDRWPDHNGDYAPGNCRWATPTEQQRNKRNSTMLDYQGRRMHAYDWAVHLGLSINTVRKRLRTTRDPDFVLRPVARHQERLS